MFPELPCVVRSEQQLQFLAWFKSLSRASNILHHAHAASNCKIMGTTQHQLNGVQYLSTTGCSGPLGDPLGPFYNMLR